MPLEVKRSFCIDSSGVRRIWRSSRPTGDTDEFPLISATKPNPHRVTLQAHTKHRSVFTHIQETSFKVRRSQ